MSEFRDEPFDLAVIREDGGGLGRGILGMPAKLHTHQAGDLVVLPLRVVNTRWMIFGACVHLSVVNRHRNSSWSIRREGRGQLMLFPETRQMITLAGQFVSHPLRERFDMPAGDLEFQHFGECLLGVLKGSAVAAEKGYLSQQHGRVVLGAQFKELPAWGKKSAGNLYS